MDVSVIIPIYNVEEYLGACLESVWANISGLDAEALLIDDGSTDGSGEIAASFARTHASVTYIRQENAGPSVARNRAIAQAQGDYLFFVDSDDLLVEGTLAKMLSAARESGSDMTVCDVARYSESKGISGSLLQVAAFTTLAHNTTSIYEHPKLAYDSITCNKLIRRSFWDRCGAAFPVGYATCEDYYVMLPLYLQANSVTVVRGVGYLWRVREGENLSNTQRHAERKNLTDRIAMITGVFEALDRFAAPDDVRCAVEDKLLNMDFTGYLSKLGLMERADAEEYVELMAQAVEALARPESLDRQPLKIRQKMHDLLARDVDALIELEGYLHEGYASAPVRREGARLVADVDARVFAGGSCDCTSDFLAATPLSYVDRIEASAGSVLIEGHLYQPRLSIANPTEQKVHAYLANECTGELVPLACSSCWCRHLTESKGTVPAPDGGTPVKYNYDGTGFQITVSFREISGRDGLMGENYLVLEYENWLKHDRRILRGAGKRARGAVEGLVWGGGRHQWRICWDERGTLCLRLERPQTVGGFVDRGRTLARLAARRVKGRGKANP